MATIYKYLLGIGIVLFVALGVFSWFVFGAWQSTKEDLVKEQAITEQLNIKIDEQQETIEDYSRQNTIINHQLAIVNERYNALEKEYIDIQNETDAIVNDSTTKETSEAERILQERLDSTLNRLQNTTRK